MATFNAVCYFPETGEFEIVWVQAEDVQQARAKAAAAAEHDGVVPEVDSVSISND